jgi:hypothetical protein
MASRWPAIPVAGQRRLDSLICCAGASGPGAKCRPPCGFSQTPTALPRRKLKRGTFSATFFLACLAALELDGVSLERDLALLDRLFVGPACRIKNFGIAYLAFYILWPLNF